jgi:MinD-like ATPase involved in chromosome partitioning or flagellar assembly
MLKIAMYSYKGGAGRTVATANIAALMASMGKKVVCVDFDLDGPGLKIVFGLSHASDDRYVQDYMNAYTPKSFPLRECLIDTYSSFPESKLGKDLLYVFPASQDFKKRLPDNYDYHQILDRINSLMEWLEEHENPDYVFLDCASGWRILPKACTQAADYILTFLRLSRQHILGAVTIAGLFKFLEFEFNLIPSAVPQDLLDREEEFAGYIQALESAFPGRVLNPLPEFSRLKWDETPLCLDPEEMQEFTNSESRNSQEHIIARYKAIALHILEIGEGLRI